MFRNLYRPASALALAGLAALAACNSDNGVNVAPPVTKTITVDASAAYAYIHFQDTLATLVSVASPSTSSAWDMGFFATGVTLNGGMAGPGGVEAFCLCEHAAATTAQIQAFTADNTLSLFDSVTVGMLPGPSAAWVSDQLDPVFNSWYTGTGAAATVTAGKTFITREGSPTVVLGKVQILSLIGPNASNAGQVVFQFAVEPSAGAAFGATVVDTVSTTSGPVYFDLTSGAVTDVSNWDIEFDGWYIRVNGGVSGSGTVKAVPDNVTPFASIDYAYASSAPPQAYRSDTFSGIFAQNPWYKYNITGSDNQIWPLFNVYLIRRGTAIYKVQLTGYYSTTGAPRNITIRYSKMAG